MEDEGRGMRIYTDKEIHARHIKNLEARVKELENYIEKNTKLANAFSEEIKGLKKEIDHIVTALFILGIVQLILAISIIASAVIHR